MIIDPKYILDNNIVTLPSSVTTDQVLQPNGIDLYVNEIFELQKSYDSENFITIGDLVKTKHSAQNQLHPKIDDNNREYFTLLSNNLYKIETNYGIDIPKDMVAYIFTRSSLNRNGNLIGSGLWDSGFKGSIGTTLYTFNNMHLVKPCKIAQIVFIKAESSYLYQGQYQSK